jgi:hypothetical protein
MIAQNPMETFLPESLNMFRVISQLPEIHAPAKATDSEEWLPWNRQDCPPGGGSPNLLQERLRIGQVLEDFKTNNEIAGTQRGIWLQQINTVELRIRVASPGPFDGLNAAVVTSVSDIRMVTEHRLSNESLSATEIKDLPGPDAIYLGRQIANKAANEELNDRILCLIFSLIAGNGRVH